MTCIFKKAIPVKQLKKQTNKKKVHTLSGGIWNLTQLCKPKPLIIARNLLFPEAVLQTVWTKGSILISEMLTYRKMCSSTWVKEWNYKDNR